MEKELIELFRKGSNCPECERYGKIYKRDININLINVLFYIYSETERNMPSDGWIILSNELEVISNRCGTKEYSKLRFWNLIEFKIENKGIWRITEHGIMFVQGKVRIPKTAEIFGNKLIGLEGELVSVSDIMKKNIDYEKLMGVSKK